MMVKKNHMNSLHILTRGIVSVSLMFVGSIAIEKSKQSKAAHKPEHPLQDVLLQMPLGIASTMFIWLLKVIKTLFQSPDHIAPLTFMINNKLTNQSSHISITMHKTFTMFAYLTIDFAFIVF